MKFPAASYPRTMRGFLFGLMLTLSVSAQAAPYTPSSDALVLLKIPASLNQARATQGQNLNPQQAASLAQIFIQRGRASGDPRELGYAQGVIAPWSSLPTPPQELLLIRATLLQARHEFTAALTDLDTLLEAQPKNAQAWLTRATVLRVLGRYPEAQQACQKLEGITHSFISNLCSLSIRGLNGDLLAATQALDQLRPQRASQASSISAWYYAERVGMAERAGQHAQTEALYQEALLMHPNDSDLRAGYADWLLDADRPREILGLIDANEKQENLRLRRALAMLALKDPDFAALDAEIRSYFEAAHLRNEDMHLREEARYRLATGENQQALQLARSNWAVQHEPWDARLLLEAARANSDPAAAQVVLEWLKDSRLQDVRLQEAAP